MNWGWWLLVLLLCVAPLADPLTSTSSKQQNNPKSSKQGKVQGAALHRQQGKPTVGSKPVTGGAKTATRGKTTTPAPSSPPESKLTASFKEGEKLEQTIKTLQQQLKDAEKKQAKLLEEQKKEALAAKQRAKAKEQLPRQLYKQPVKSRRELDSTINALKCTKKGNELCLKDTTCCITARGEWGCCLAPNVSRFVAGSCSLHVSKRKFSGRSRCVMAGCDLCFECYSVHEPILSNFVSVWFAEHSQELWTIPCWFCIPG